MADSAASASFRTAYAASSKPRTVAAVSPDTEKKLARAARSAQRLARLADGCAETGNLELFPDDPTRATLAAMTIDVRQGTLDGFELPEVVRVALAAGTVGPVETVTEREGKGGRRTALRVARVDDGAQAAASGDIQNAVWGVQETLLGDEGRLEASENGSLAALHAESAAAPSAAPDADDEPAQSVLPTAPGSSIASATVMRSVIALRQAAQQRDGGLFAPARSSLTRVGKEVDVGVATDAAGGAEIGSEADVGAAVSSATAHLAQRSETAARRPSTIAPASIRTPAQRDASNTPAAPPDLDRARAAAFADTVDALYGVIADQGALVADHARRMRWLLSAAIGALVVAVIIGVVQTVLLTRLTRETTAQQQRSDQLMQNQQAAMISLIDSHLAVAQGQAQPQPQPPVDHSTTHPARNSGRHAASH